MKLIYFLVGQFCARSKRGQKAGQGSIKGLGDKGFALERQKRVLGQQRGYHAVVILEDSTVAQPFEHGIGGRLFPLQFLGAQFYQFTGGDGLVVPDQIGETQLHCPEFVIRHLKHLLLV